MAVNVLIRIYFLLLGLQVKATGLILEVAKKKGEKHWLMPYIQKDSLKPDEFYGGKKMTLKNRPVCHSAAMLVDYIDPRADKNVTILAKRYEERPSVCIQPACI